MSGNMNKKKRPIEYKEYQWTRQFELKKKIYAARDNQNQLYKRITISATNEDPGHSENHTQEQRQTHIHQLHDGLNHQVNNDAPDDRDQLFDNSESENEADFNNDYDTYITNQTDVCLDDVDVFVDKQINFIFDFNVDADNDRSDNRERTAVEATDHDLDTNFIGNNSQNPLSNFNIYDVADDGRILSITGDLDTTSSLI
ncbi:hypothetical protein HCN44_000824 [Aphidius gifuensis]|uniref:Uncharacterized protein n=1 Tax=Aphidius gifuensis TaxID=684658 RepID=A0A835CNP0_APHGI|nr:hypothetical protein HCN44_000824 [Aphidius gifuensis]